MSRAVATGLLLCAVLSSCRQRASPPAIRPLDPIAAMSKRIGQTPGAIVRLVAFRLDGSGPRLTLLADSLVHAASTMKVPVLIELARRSDRTTLSLDSTVLLVNDFGSIVDGSRYQLSRDDDSDDSVYARIGQRVSIRWLATRMITHSSNLATNFLLTVVRADSVTAMTRALGTSRMVVRRGVEDTPAFRAGLNNLTTANDLAALLAAIATDRAASAQASAWMREVLFAQAFNSAIPAGLPVGTRVAHKTGDITRVEHDAAIVYPSRGSPYVLVILTNGIEGQAEARRLIADLAGIAHAALAH
jgi:beta-lactamase class A